MADPTFQLSPYANFDSSQWNNPFSRFQGQAMPWPSSYSGWPTDAMGNPIQAPPGMTINQTPAQPTPAPAAAPAPAANQSGAFSPQQAMRMLQANGQWGLSSPAGNGRGGVNNQAALDAFAQLTAGYKPQAQQPAAQPAAQPAVGGGSGGPSYSDVLRLLANPGQVTTPGATVAAAAQPSNSVLQQFLAGWKPATSGAGSGFQQAFAKALGR